MNAYHYPFLHTAQETIQHLLMKDLKVLQFLVRDGTVVQCMPIDRTDWCF